MYKTKLIIFYILPKDCIPNNLKLWVFYRITQSDCKRNYIEKRTDRCFEFQLNEQCHNEQVSPIFEHLQHCEGFNHKFTQFFQDHQGYTDGHC